MFFLGHDVSYWIELEKQAQEGNFGKMLEDLIETRKRLWQAEGQLKSIQEILLARSN